MKPGAAMPPTRFDFVILTVNDVETDEAVKVLGLSQNGKESGLNYRWGLIPRKVGQSLPVALVSFNDQQGVAEAVNRTNEIVDVLKPQYLLVLGTAGGLQRNDEELTTGDVVVSSIVQYGTFKDADKTTHRALRIMPPNSELFDQANEVAKYSSWRDDLSADVKRPAAGTPKVIFKEIASTDILMANLQQPILQLFLNNCPRIAAVEMEAGGVAMKLTAALKEERIPGYLVIKGISDIADKARAPNGKGGNQQERDEWRRYASHVSAWFARNLIITFEPKRRWPTPLKRLLPAELRDSLLINTDCAGVFYNVSPQAYSEFTTHHLERMSIHSDPEDSLFFTLSIFDPPRLMEMMQRQYNYQYNREPGKSVPCSKLKTWAPANFPHFKTFQQFAADKERIKHCVRIVLLDDFETWTSGLTKDQWNLFKSVNGNVPCWAIERSFLRNKTPFISEYVVICGRLVLDYYEESSMLIVTELFDDAVKRNFLWLKSRFDNSRWAEDPFPFKPLDELEKEVMEKFATPK